MAELRLKASVREERGKALTPLRRAGFIPGVVYGYKVDNTPVKVEGVLFKRIFDEAGANALITLDIEGTSPATVLIQDVAVDPVRQQPLHVDFFAVNLAEKVHAEVPLSIIGEAPAVKELEGILIQPLHAIEVESLPQDIPHDIAVDISSLASFDDHIAVRDLPVSQNVTVLTSPDEIVASVQPPRSEEELEALDETLDEQAAMDQVEGIAEEVSESEEEGPEKGTVPEGSEESA